MTEQAYTTGMIARHCGVSFTTVIRWITAGRIKAYQLPGRGDRRVRAADFRRFLLDNAMPLPAELASGREAGTGGDDPREDGPRVLLVDDDRPLLEIMRKHLQAAGFRVNCALDGFAAGRQLVAFSPRVMVLDLRMPGMDGMEVLASLRRDEAYRDLGVIVLTGLGRAARERALEQGADRALPKPLRPSRLVEAIGEVLRAKGACHVQ